MGTQRGGKTRTPASFCEASQSIGHQWVRFVDAAVFWMGHLGIPPQYAALEDAARASVRRSAYLGRADPRLNRDRSCRGWRGSEGLETHRAGRGGGPED